MKKSTILLVSLLPIILFSSYTSTIKGPASKLANKDCESLSLVYEDALAYFENYKGEKKVKKTLMGTSSINGYNINLWDAKKVELSEAPDLGCNQLDYTYHEASNLASAEEVYNILVEKFELCKPDGYIKIESTSKSKLRNSKYIDQRDQDTFLFYDWPEFELSIINISNTYTVTMRILSKKMN